MNDNRYLLKIMTYNMHGGKRVVTTPLSKYKFIKKTFNLLPMTFLNNLKPITKFLHNENAHIIGLQEINENDKHGYQVNNIKDNLQINGVFASNVKIKNGYYGVGTFTCLKISKTKNILLPSLKEQRGLLHTVVEIGDLEINVLNTHLGLNKEERKGQFKAIREYLKSLKSPIVLMGDFNTTDPDIDDLYLVDAAKTMKKEYLETFMNSGKRIDYIFLSESIQILDYKVVPIKLSDHYPVIVEVLI